MSIIINETDNTLYGTRTADTDNIVFIPGSAITGPSDPTLYTSYNDFIKNCGDHGCEGSLTWEYIANMLLAGFPVLFQRITHSGTATTSPTELVKHAKLDVRTSNNPTPNPNPSQIDFVVPSGDLLGKTVSDLSNNNIEFNENLVSGTLKYVSNYTGFSSNPDEQEGYFLPFKITVPSEIDNTDDTVAKFKVIGGQDKYVNVDKHDFTYIVFLGKTLKDVKSKSVEVVIDWDENSKETYPTYTTTLNLQKLELLDKSGETVQDEGEIILTFEEIFGGSYGNDLKVSLVREYETIYMRLYYKTTIIETFKIASVTDNMSEEDINKAVVQGLIAVESTKVKISIPNENKFVFKDINNLSLSGGADADESLILAEIAEADYQNSIYRNLEDKYIHNIKFITSGGYIDTNLVVAKNLTQLAEDRKDCVAIVDIPMGIEKGVANRYFNTINSSYAAAFAPWCYVELATKSKKWMPPSFVFLTRLARSVVDNGNPLWYPVAGVKRASLSNVLKTEYEIGGTMLDEWQELNQQALNPIMKLRSYGYVIYGQRTLYATDDSNYPSPSALRQLGVRITANEVKRAIFDIAIGLKFEKNDLYTWNEFTTLLKPLLTSMKSDRGITDYQLLMNANTTTEEDIQEYRIRGIVRISVLNSAENFEIDFSLEPSSVTFSDETLI